MSTVASTTASTPSARLRSAATLMTRSSPPARSATSRRAFSSVDAERPHRHTRHPSRRQRPRAGQSEATTGARDDGDLVVEAEIHEHRIIAERFDTVSHVHCAGLEDRAHGAGGGRESGNIEDRRGMGGMGVGLPIGGGIGGLVLVLLFSFLTGTNPLNLISGGGPAPSDQTTGTTGLREKDPQAEFVARVLADTEDTWRDIFQKRGQADTHAHARPLQRRDAVGMRRRTR